MKGQGAPEALCDEEVASQGRQPPTPRRPQEENQAEQLQNPLLCRIVLVVLVIIKIIGPVMLR